MVGRGSDAMSGDESEYTPSPYIPMDSGLVDSSICSSTAASSDSLYARLGVYDLVRRVAFAFVVARRGELGSELDREAEAEDVEGAWIVAFVPASSSSTLGPNVSRQASNLRIAASRLSPFRPPTNKFDMCLHLSTSAGGIVPSLIFLFPAFSFAFSSGVGAG